MTMKNREKPGFLAIGCYKQAVVATTSSEAGCPLCHCCSANIHSRYGRLTLPVSGTLTGRVFNAYIMQSDYTAPNEGKAASYDFRNSG